MTAVIQCCRLGRHPYETEINEEIASLYDEMQERGDSDGDEEDVQHVENKLQELEQKMEQKIEASNSRLEERIDASSMRLESKMEDSHQRLEAMIRQLLGSQTALTPQPEKELLVTATPVSLQVTLE
jgi:polyhydroxyalkanoate synthesis regulator phasin